MVRRYGLVQGGDQGPRVGRVLVLPVKPDTRFAHPETLAGPASNLRTSAPGYGGIFVEVLPNG